MANFHAAAVEQSQVHSVIHQLHRLGFLKQNPAHKTYKVDPQLRPHLAALAQQQPSALYSPSLLGWSQACLQTCSTATALYKAHAQVCLKVTSYSNCLQHCALDTALCIAHAETGHDVETM